MFEDSCLYMCYAYIFMLFSTINFIIVSKYIPTMHKWIFWTFVVLIVCVVLALTYISVLPPTMLEGMIETEPTPENGIIPFGYYRIDDENMAKLPYGYKVDSSDTTMKTIVALTNAAAYTNRPLSIPQNGIIPEGYYKVSDGFMSILPPGMKPKMQGINPNGTYVYETGYMNENAFYELRFPMPDKATSLPPGTYLSDVPGMIAVLPYGKIPNGFDKSGYTENPSLISQTGEFSSLQNLKYRDLSGTYDVKFHEDAESLMKKDYMFGESIGSITVLSPSGEYITIPRAATQGDLMYNEPGTFKYGSQTYVPNYEDSVYLSRVAKQELKPDYFTPTDIQSGFCEYYKDNPDKIEENCGNLDKSACSSSSCCVLLGGAKCVYGSENGPHNRTHYSDVFVRNKDYYYYQGKCYGNCSQ